MKKNVGKISHFEQITIKTFCKFLQGNQFWTKFNQTFDIKSNYLIIHGRFIQTLFQQKNSVKMIWRN